MEKMFVYPETLDSRVTWDENTETSQSMSLRADVASHRCKLYRTLLEQRTASQQARLAWMDDERATDSAHA
jgi:hypothetical protein